MWLIDVKTTVIFDVNETLLDLKALDPHFERIFGDVNVRRLWFGRMLQIALSLTILGEYKAFAEVGRDALTVLANQRGKTLSPDDLAQISEQMLHLPAHPDVIDSLARLKAGGAQVAALTNSDAQSAVAQLTNAGLADSFDAILSVEAVRRFKPDAAVYSMMIDRLGIVASESWFVAAHDWDIVGAMACGLQGAYLVRGVGDANPAYPLPTFIGRDMADIVDHIIERS